MKIVFISFELGRGINRTNVLTKFHEDQTINVVSGVFTRQNVDDGQKAITKAPSNKRASKAQNIIGTNLLTKFHVDRKINVASTVLTRKNAPPPGSHVFQPTGIIFELVQDIIGMNLLKFHEDQTVNVASRVLTRFYYSHIWKNAPPLGSHFFQANIFILELIQDIIETNLLTKFHEDWTINVAPRVLTRKNARPWWPYIIGTYLLTKFHDDRKINVTSRPRPHGGHVFQPSGIIFELLQDIIRMNLLTEFHEDQTINVASRVLTRFYYTNVTIFELIQDIIKTNLLTIFHHDWTINFASRVLTRKSAPPPGGHVFQPTGIIFELVQDIIGMNLLTTFHEDWTINVASRVYIWKNAPPLGSHVFQAKVTIFELIQDIMLTRKNAPPPGGFFF
ncbi:hypothetical protein DPMN_180985 [Dreissena polymorpha]|uniref:Uncharacterized protein n=1 Tax=Dreissena polymorpha TaxID=45954 RepID=A0A9D4I158_DREPO|nr:hypothetical protein DPMN_180985 [Dreissena polymorpha]